jgi:hypothetical protein
MKKTTMNLKKLKTSPVEKMLNAISNRPTNGDGKKVVDLTSLAQNLAKRHVEKLKSSPEEE